jgi:rfaE bifunctional protein kinase chain/domain
LKTVFVSGSFNVLHPGHLRLLRFAKDCGDKLYVAVLSDRISGKAAHVHEHLRLQGVESIGFVDEAFIVDESIINVITELRPNVVVKGKEYELAFNPELAIVKQYGGILLFSSGEATFSSLDLIAKEFESTNSSNILLPEEFMIRHDIQNESLINLVKNFSSLNVCVLGDLIIDEYITCEPLGMSQEDPTIVVTPVDSKLFIGGAAIVAAHASGLGAKVCLLSVTGNDTMRKFAIDSLSEYNVEAKLIIDESRPTSLKQRYRSKGKSLLKVSHLHQDAIANELQEMVLSELETHLDLVDLLIFSDFNYGFLPQAMVNRIIDLARSRKIYMAADSQSSSQLGDISRFKGVNLITPTEREARVSIRNRDDGLVVLAEEVRKKSEANIVFLKLGEEGLLVHAGNTSGSDWITDRILALNNTPKDVAGAGDSMLIASAMALACGGSIWDAACLGSLSAAIQIGRVGNTPLRAKELIQELS